MSLLFALSLLLFLIPSFFFFAKNQEKRAIWWLLAAAAAMRIAMIQVDPYLHDWDERFHAVVAKNMMGHPLKPMMRLEAVLPYRPDEWCCNYIWVHKQPLFLWQMALSMKIFGANVFGLRLPNVLMGMLMVWSTFRIGKIWSGAWQTGYLGALLVATSYYHLELSSGMMSLDHNDLMMGGYVTASLWAFSEYMASGRRKWAIWTGIFIGAAILVKWLTGLLVLGGWGLYLLLEPEWRGKGQRWLHLLTAIAVAVLVFLPWQVYIRLAFPAEAAASYRHNVQHIFEPLGHPGDYLTHWDFLWTAYSGKWLLGLMAIGWIVSWMRPANRRFSVAMTAMVLVVYAFFSFIVATKMRGLTFPVTAIGFTWIAMGGSAVITAAGYAFRRWYRIPVAVALAFFTGAAYYALQPLKMVQSRTAAQTERNKKLHNTALYQRLNEYVTPDEIVLNCKAFEDTEVRFWQPNNAYHWYPTAQQIDSLLNAGYKLSAFKSHNDQGLPGYIQDNPRVHIIDAEVK